MPPPRTNITLRNASSLQLHRCFPPTSDPALELCRPHLSSITIPHFNCTPIFLYHSPLQLLSSHYTSLRRTVRYKNRSASNTSVYFIMCIPEPNTSTSTSETTATATVILQRKSSLLAVTDTSPRSTIIKKTVRFDAVQFREYPVVLGDHPNTTTGPAITIDWEPIKTYQLDLELYEGPRVNYRRTAAELRMPAFIRRSLLQGSDTSEGEMRAVASASRKIQHQRRLSMTVGESLEPMEILTASAVRKWKRFGIGQKKAPQDPAAAWLEQHMTRSNKATVSSVTLNKNTFRNAKMTVARKKSTADPMDESSTETMRTVASVDDVDVAAGYPRL